MGTALKLNECYDEPAGEKRPPRVRAVDSNEDGGNLDEILKRLDRMESIVLETRDQVSGLVAIIPHLATKADLSKVNEAVGNIAAIIPHLATKTDLSKVNEVVSSIAAQIPYLAKKSDLTALESSLIKWMVATALACTGLAFTLAKLIH